MGLPLRMKRNKVTHKKDSTRMRAN
jgi:hypothetical protein